MTAIANGVSLSWCRVTIPWSGVPVLELAAPEPVTPIAGVVTVTLADLVVSAALVRSGEFAGQWKGFAVGGRNGWSKRIARKGYRSPFGLLNAQIISDAALECGELPPVVAPPSFMGGFYIRTSTSPASQVFTKLPDGQDWWIDPLTGITQVGLRVPAVVNAQFDIIDVDPGSGRLTIATDNPSQFQPNATFIDPFAGVFVVNAVVWTSTAGKLRGEVWTA